MQIIIFCFKKSIQVYSYVKRFVLGIIDFHVPSHLKFGVDVINRVGNLTSEFGTKVVIVTEGVLYESGTINKVVEVLRKKGRDPIVFDDIIPNAMSDIVDDGVRRVRSANADVVIGMGGVRALSIAKAIAMLAPTDDEISDYISGNKIATHKSLPYIEIPSTPRNPFMFVDKVWLTDARNRNTVLLAVPENTTKYIVFDPMITTTLRSTYTAATIIDTMANAIEGYISTKSNYFSDTLFLKGLELFDENLFLSINNPDDIGARGLLSLGGLFTCLGLSMTYTGITAALSYVLSSKYKIHRTTSTSVLLPHVLDFNITAVPAKLVNVAKALNQDITNLSVVEAAIKAIEHIRKIILKLKLPIRLKEFALNKDDLITIADEARKLEMFNYVPRPCTSEELYEILQAAF